MAVDLATTQNPVTIYAEMRPDYRTAIAEEFMRLLRLAGDNAAPYYHVPPMETLTAEQVAALHVYTRDRHPDLFDMVMRHPVTLLALASLAPAGARRR
jgi:hypothetical protein